LEDCHEDVKFASQLRQVSDRIEAIYASRRRGRKRDGYTASSFDLRRQTLIGAQRHPRQKGAARVLL